MSSIEKGEKIAEGKTKIIWTVHRKNNQVLIESKEDITAGDGLEHNIIENKDVLSTETTCNCFCLLHNSTDLTKKSGAPTHFIERIDERSFLARRVGMIPLELVVRRVAAGSYLERYPSSQEGTRFNQPVVEFFLKDDIRHDHDVVGDQWLFYQSKMPLGEGFMEVAALYGYRIEPQHVLELRSISLEVFRILEDAWKLQNVWLVDLKIECGFLLDSAGKIIPDWIVVADVIDNDSWRIWPAGDKSQMKDKQVYRDTKDKTPQALAAIMENYAWVAKATAKFL